MDHGLFQDLVEKSGRQIRYCPVSDDLTGSFMKTSPSVSFLQFVERARPVFLEKTR
jgi:hypothetical protein